MSDEAKDVKAVLFLLAVLMRWTADNGDDNITMNEGQLRSPCRCVLGGCSVREKPSKLKHEPRTYTQSNLGDLFTRDW